MATNRTGTAKWKHLRREVLQQAINEGVTHCPRCRVLLDYRNGTAMNGATVDHIIAYARGGSDRRENLQVLCRRCNQHLGKKARPNPNRPKSVSKITTTINW